MDSIDIYRGADLFVTIKPDGSSNQQKQVMGNNLVTIVFEDNHYIKFAINDYVTIFGERYQLSQLPTITKGSRYFYKYTLVMNSEGYDLAKIQYLFLGADNALREADFSLMANADKFVDLVISNANRAGSGWIKGQVIPSGYKNLTFSKENCYNALSRLAEEFKTEFWVVGKTIHLTKKSTDTGQIYKQGRYKGLYEITRQNSSDANVITRLWAFGAEKNLPTDYNGGARRLQMRSTIATPLVEPLLIHDVTCVVVDNGDGTQDMTFTFTPATDGSVAAQTIEYRLVGTSGTWHASTGSAASPRTITAVIGTYNVRFRSQNSGVVTSEITVSGTFATSLLPSTGFQPQYYVEDNVALYGVIESTEYFDDIFPRRTGTVTSINVSDFYKFFDTSMDFDVNNQLLPGISAKITFNTGQLAGYTFNIGNYNNATKEFTILKNKDEKILDVPSADLKPAIGDTYVLTDILMPKTYIDAAEVELKNAAIALLDQISEPQVKYTMIFDPAFLKNLTRQLNIGDLVWISDDELELLKKIRIISTTRNIVNEYQYQAELSDIVTLGTISLIVNAQLNNDRDINSVQQQFLNNSILNNNVIGDLKIKLGTLIFENIPTTSTTVGFSQIYIEDATGKLFKKV